MRFYVLALSALAASLALLLIAGCGSEDAGEPAVEGTTPTATATVPDEAPAVVALYFLRDAPSEGTDERPDGWVGLVRRSVVVEESRIATATMKALLAGPTPAERKAGLWSAIPDGVSLESLEIEDGIATVEFPQDSPLAEAQAVYTLTQFPSVQRVSIDNRLVRRADFEDYTPAILVEAPAPWEQVASPLRISGSANTFEATFQAEIVDASGNVLGKRFITATSGSGTRGTFEAPIPFRYRPGGKLVVYELSAEDGSRINEVEIPLELVRE